MSFMNEKKREETESYYAKLPYKFGYLLLLLIVVIIVIHSTVSAYNTILERERKLENEADTCLVHFSNKKCDVSTPTDECQRLLLCLKKKDEQIGTI